MENRSFDRIATSLADARSRRDTFHLFGAALIGVGGAGLLAVESEAKRGKKRKKKNQNQGQDQDPQIPTSPPPPAQFADIVITAILVEPTAEAAHDNLVVQYTNAGTLAATGFRIGMVAKRTNGQIRNEGFLLPLTVAPGQSGTEKFRLGCNWINGGTITVRTDPSPVPGESAAAAGNNTLSQTFGAAICS